jgi:5-bromo-4-chloroindolyl phosphate hydrolysis protein
LAKSIECVQVVNEIFSYQISREKIKYIYKDDPERLKEMEDFLYKSSYPAALKQLRAEKRRRTNQDAEDKNLLTF